MPDGSVFKFVSLSVYVREKNYEWGNSWADEYAKDTRLPVETTTGDVFDTVVSDAYFSSRPYYL